jgi:hypothetical protein
MPSRTAPGNEDADHLRALARTGLCATLMMIPVAMSDTIRLERP